MSLLDRIEDLWRDPRREFGVRIVTEPTIATDLRAIRTRDGGKIPALRIFWKLFAALWEYPSIFQYKIDPSLRGVSELTYMILTVAERMFKAKENGEKIVGKWPANPTDIYFGSGVRAIDPFFTAFCKMLASGENIMAQRGRSHLSEDSCPAQAAAYIALTEEMIPMDHFYPFIGPWCYDSQYCFEALREKVTGDFGDHPVYAGNEHKKLSYDYMRGEIEAFIKKMEELTGKKVDPEQLRQEFILENKLRTVLREISSFALLEPSPVSSLDLILCIFISSDWLGDPEATLQVLTRIRDCARKRIAKKIPGYNVQPNPVRILITGIAWGDIGLYSIVDELGGLVVGSECVLNLYYEDIDTEGDPIDVLTRRFLAVPYTLPAQERAEWTVENVRKAQNVEGVVFNCNFGCNYQAAEARMVSDILKKEGGIPCIITDSDLPKENRGQMRTRLEAFIEMLRNKRQ